MLFFDKESFESQTTQLLNSTVANLSKNQIHTYNVDEDKKSVEFEILPLDNFDNIGGTDFEREDTIAMARLFEKNALQYNFSGVVPSYEVRLLQVRESGSTSTFVEKSDTKSSDPLKSEPERSIIITLIVLAGLSVLGFVVWLMTRSSPQSQFPQFGMGGMMFGQGPMSPGGQMGPMSPHLGGMNPMSPTNSFKGGTPMGAPQMMGGAGVAPPMMAGAGGWNSIRNTFGAVNAFGKMGFNGMNNPQGMDIVNPSFMQQKPGTFSPRFYTGGMQPNG